MQMHEVEELKEAYTIEEAQQELDAGWKLLTVVVAQLTAGGPMSRVYVLGRRKPRERPVRDGADRPRTDPPRR